MSIKPLIPICVPSILLVFAIGSAGGLTTAVAEDGVSGDTILFGQVAALSGPAQDLGQGVRLGLLAAFRAANSQGGIAGRQLGLKSLDDGYEPRRTVDATKALLNDDKVFALIGGVGTPTAKAGQPIATEAKTPFMAPFTGAQFLRDPFNRYVVNLRASYFQETEAWIAHLTNDLRITKIAVLYQDDAFGLAGLEGIQRALAKRGLTPAAAASFKRNTTAVKTALLDIMAAEPEAVISIAPYRPVAAFIKLAHQVKLNAVFGAISFVGSGSLAQELGSEGSGVIVSQVVPSPFDPSLPVVASYQQALAAEDAQARPEFVTLEGYLAGRLANEALKRIHGEITREALLDAVYAAPFDFGGFTLSYGPAKNQGSDQIYFTALRGDGTFKPLRALERVSAQ